MRYLVFLLCFTVAAPPLASADDAEPGSTEPAIGVESSGDEGLSPRLRKRTRQKWDPNTYQLRLDSSGLNVSPDTSPSKSSDRRVRQYRQGLIASSAFFAAGAGFMGAGYAIANNQADRGDWIPAGGIAVFTLGAVMATGGFVGMLVSGAKLNTRKRELREIYGVERVNPRRVRWDVDSGRFVF